MRISKFLVLALAFWSVGASALSTLTYRIYDYPVAGKDCHEVARQIAQEFEKASQLKTTSALCLSETKGRGELEILYEAEEPFPIATTDYESISSFSRGRFENEKTCLGSLPMDREFFTTATGLTPLIAYCRHLGTSAKKVWMTHIEAVGTPLLRPRLGGFFFFTVPQDLTMTNLKAALQKALGAKGYLFVDAVVFSRMAMADVAIHYYADQSVNFEAKPVARVAKKEQCAEAVNELNDLASSQNALPRISFCGKNSVQGGYEVTGVYAGQPVRSPILSLNKFKSYEECRSQKNQVVEYYKVTLKQPVIAGICTAGAEAYQVSLLR